MMRVEVIQWNLERWVAEHEQADIKFEGGFVWLVFDAKRAIGIRRDLVDRIELTEGES